jgi:uncharacterized RDD family membrane protein YckC
VTDPALSPSEQSRVHYAGFGLRLKAGVIDFLVFLPVIALGIWTMNRGRGAYIAYLAGCNVVYFAYTIVGHAVWGQTVGKRVARIRVLDVTNQPIGWRQAVRRSSVDIILGVLSLAAYWIVLSRIPATEFEGPDRASVEERYAALRPWWAAAIEYAYWAWLASEIVSVLFNRRRRALHDFIAGTVVVREARSGAPTLRGWRRALSGVDAAASVLGLVAGAFFGLAAVSAETIPDPSARQGLAILAANSVALAAAYALAGRALRKRSHWHWTLHAMAALLTVLPLLPLLMVLPARS